jgi:ribonuclease R
MEKKSILIKRPFTLIGKISLSAKGDGFVKLASGNEAFVPGNKSDTAMAGDLVDISPIGLGRKDRMEAEVLRIHKRGRVLYRMKVREIEDKFIFGKFLDMTGEEKEGLLLKKSLLIDHIKNIKIDDVLIVKMKDIDSNEPNLYEVSFVRFESDSKEDPDFLRVMMKYNFQQNHPDHISIDYPEEVSSKTVSDWKSRKDLTKLYAITIDGATAKDFDEAYEDPETVKRKTYDNFTQLIASKKFNEGSEILVDYIKKTTRIYTTKDDIKSEYFLIRNE